MGKYAGELRLKQIRGGIELYKYIPEGSGSWSYYSIKKDTWEFVNTAGWAKLDAAETLCNGLSFKETILVAIEYYEDIAKKSMQRIRDLPYGKPRDILFKHATEMTTEITSPTYRKVRLKVLDFVNIQNELVKVETAYEMLDNYDESNLV